VPIQHEVITLGPGHVIHVRSNLLAAIRIAAEAGAARILLLGIDPEFYETHLAGDGTVAGLAALTQELMAAGVAVDRFCLPPDFEGAECPA